MNPGDKVVKTGSPNDYTTGRTGIVLEVGHLDMADKVCVRWDETGHESWIGYNRYRGVVLETDFPKWENSIKTRRKPNRGDTHIQRP